MGNSESKRHASAGPATQQQQQPVKAQRAPHDKQQQQQQQQSVRSGVMLSPRGAKQRASHYASPLKGGAAGVPDDNGDLGAACIHSNRSPNVKAYPGAAVASAGRKKKEKTKGKHKSAVQAPQQRQQLALQQQQQQRPERGLCPPPAMDAAANAAPTSAPVRHKPHGSVPPNAFGAPIVVGIPVVSGDDNNNSGGVKQQSRRGSASASRPATAPRVLECTDAEIPVTRMVHVGASRRNSLNTGSSNNSDEVDSSPILRGASLARRRAPAATTAPLVSVRAPSPTVVARLTVSVNSSAAKATSSSSSNSSSAAPSASPSASNSADTSPTKATPSSATPTTDALTATVAVVAVAAVSVGPPVPPRSSRGRTRSLIEASPKAKAQGALVRSASICAGPLAAPDFLAPRPIMIGRSSSVPPLVVSSDRAASFSMAASPSPSPSVASPALSLRPPLIAAAVLPNSHPLTSFIDSWAWLPPTSADPFTPGRSCSTTLDPARFPAASRGLLMAMDLATLRAPSRSQLDLLWLYAEGLGGARDPSARSPSALDGPGSGFLSRPRLMLLASEVSSKLQHHYVCELKREGAGGSRMRKWKHVARALADQRPFLLPPPAKAAPSHPAAAGSPKPLSPSASAHSALTAASVAAAAACPAHLAHLRSLTGVLLRALDLNGDHRVSRAEFMAAWPAAIGKLCDQAFDQGGTASGRKGGRRTDGVISCVVM